MRKWILALTALGAVVANWGCGGGSITGTTRFAYALVDGDTLTRVNLTTGLEVGNHINLTTIVRDIATRTTDGKLYGLGSDLKLYTISPVTGVCTAVSANPMALDSFNGGMAFMPGTDTIRFVSVAAHNYRISSGSGTISGTDPDSNHAAIGMGVKSSNTNYYIYSPDDKIYKTGAPQNGVFDLIGPSGFDLSGDCGLAIDNATSKGYVVANEGLFVFDLSTGAMTQISATNYEDIAIPNIQ